MAIDLNDNFDHPDDGLLEDARMAASTDWEETFVADLISKRNALGRRFELTPKQREKLGQIASDDYA